MFLKRSPMCGQISLEIAWVSHRAFQNLQYVPVIYDCVTKCRASSNNHSYDILAWVGNLGRAHLSKSLVLFGLGWGSLNGIWL